MMAVDEDRDATPMRRQPVVLIRKVAQGNTERLRRSIRRSRPYRATEPIAPPRATASETGMNDSFVP